MDTHHYLVCYLEIAFVAKLQADSVVTINKAYPKATFTEVDQRKVDERPVADGHAAVLQRLYGIRCSAY